MRPAFIIITEEHWANSHLSIARYYGGIKFLGNDYRIVNKDGIDIFTLSTPGSPHYVGDNNKAIEPGEPADLVMVEWIPIYHQLGRDKFISFLKENPGITLKQAKELCKSTNTKKKH